jgi:hypothetical protein
MAEMYAFDTPPVYAFDTPGVCFRYPRTPFFSSSSLNSSIK